ncbi:MAG: heme-binding domain-containing protein [Thermoanaerobaculia bacterium]|nr:heme-binding domain-containing protein [Thermoanaerobaculia bacterium]
MKKIFWLALLGALLAIQLIRPDMTNPPVNQAQDFRQVMQTPAGVQSILEAACYDCHSNETQYPWYSQVAPVSWWVADHINEGREALNFSTFGALNAEDRAEALEESAEKVQEGEMPLDSYTWMHPEAKLSAAQRDVLIKWLNANSGEGAEKGGEEADTKAAAEHEEED